MKRRITKEQVEQLSDEQKILLRNVWTPLPLDVVTGFSIPMVIEEVVEINNERHVTFLGYGGSAPFNMCLPLLDIGQMIELLYGRSELFHFTMFDEPKLVIVDQYNNAREAECIEKDNLCDALWDAITISLLVKEEQKDE